MPRIKTSATFRSGTSRCNLKPSPERLRESLNWAQSGTGVWGWGWDGLGGVPGGIRSRHESRFKVKQVDVRRVSGKKAMWSGGFERLDAERWGGRGGFTSLQESVLLTSLAVEIKRFLHTRPTGRFRTTFPSLTLSTLGDFFAVDNIEMQSVENSINTHVKHDEYIKNMDPCDWIHYVLAEGKGF